MNPPTTTALALVIEALREFGIKCASELNVTGTVLRFADEKAESAARALLQKLDAVQSPVTVGTESAWWALVMGAAASLQDAAACLRDPDAKRATELAAEHYRKAAKNLTEQPR